jgi:hypothetical protein
MVAFSVVQDKSKFVNVFKVEEELRNEESALRALNENNVPSVPILHGIDTDKLAMLASPLGSSMDDLQSSTAAWMILGSMFVKCLQKVHEAGWCASQRCTPHQHGVSSKQYVCHW